MGRLFNRGDDRVDGPRVAVLSYDFWLNRLGGDPRVLGSSIRIESQSFIVIGVTEARFRGLLFGFPPVMSYPMSQLSPALTGSASAFHWAAVLARLKPGHTQQSVRAELAPQWRRLLDLSLPSDRFKGEERQAYLAMPLLLTSGSNGLDYSLRDRFREPLSALLAISALVLLVACLNVANLLLARGQERRREIAVRLALGAGRVRIIRQLLAESLLLMIAGFAGAFVLSSIAARLLIGLLSANYTGFSIDMGLDLRVLAFTAGSALVAAVLFGILPAWQTSDIESASVLKAASRSVSGQRNQTRRILISGQVALTMVLVMCGALFIQNLQGLRRQELGFAAHQVMNAQLMPLPGKSLKAAAAQNYISGVLDRVRQMPGVQAASFSTFSPLFSRPYRSEVRRLDSADHMAVLTAIESVSDGFFGTMQIPLRQGSDFRNYAEAHSNASAIISETLAKRLFPGQPALGHRIRLSSGKDLEIIGVAADARLEEPHGNDLGFLYLNLWQEPEQAAWGDLQLRYSGSAEPVMKALRAELHMEGYQYVNLLRTLDEQNELSLLQERMLAGLGMAFGAVGLTLAAVGLFGLLSFFVAARQGEIGLRMALGAQRRSICGLVIREAGILVCAGIVFGSPFCVAGTRALRSLVSGVKLDVLITFGEASAVLLLVAIGAALIPVYRASSLDPAVALREE